MIRIEITKQINTKWLTRELQAAGVNVSSVAQPDEGSAYAEIQEAHEALALPVIEAHDPTETPDVLEWGHLAELESSINSELDWISGARENIVTGKGIMTNPASTQAQKNAVLSGLLDIMDRVLVEQTKEMRAWRYVFRQLKKN